MRNWIKEELERLFYAYEMQSSEAKIALIVITAIIATFIVWLSTMIYYVH